MSFFSKAVFYTGWGTLGGTLGYVALTRKNKIQPVSPTDYIFNSTQFARYNPSNLPATNDVCTRRVPVGKIKPELLESAEKGETTLVERFCAGVWSGWGYAYQRRYLEKKYRGPETSSQLWDRPALKESTYPVGTIITDHFEVLSKTPSSIIVRCGDTPRKTEVRESDGLFEMTAEVKKEEGFVEFGLKSVFFNGVAKPDEVGPEGPMGSWMQWAHQHYDRILMETAIRECMR